MEKILLMDTSVASLNKGDNIIMECIKKELQFLIKDKFMLNLPTHLTPFTILQTLRNSLRLQIYKNCPIKIVCGTNLLVKDMFIHFPQWNVNLFNYKAIEGCILMGVGAGTGEKANFYTKMIYKKMLNKNFYHSVRDERTKIFLESMGIKAINTGCPTMWMLTPEFCKDIPTNKSEEVIFTLTSKAEKDLRDQKLINILNNKYKKVYYWIQGIDDLDYLNKFENIDNINIVQPELSEYEFILNNKDIDYIGTRLHGGIYAMRHKRRAIIIAIDERAREINKSNNLNCIEKDDLDKLPDLIDSEFETRIKMPFDEIERWKNQFI